MAGCFFEVLELIEKPQAVFEGSRGELLAVREVEAGKYVVAVYKENTPEDGFVITAFLTTRIKQLERRNKVWPR